jgi:class 3 adenylate cyclase/predicted ATPase
MSVRRWLGDLGLSEFADLFEANLIDEDVLGQLTEADLQELGLPLGARVKLRAPLEELRHGRARDQVAPHDDAAERRRITVMFVDMVGSTALQSRLDPEDMAEVVGAYQDACAGVITRFGGHVARYMGDGVLAYFGWPATHEDEVDQAVRAALAIVDSVSDLEAADGTALESRVGLATGLVVVGDLIGEKDAQERTVVGETPNLAARLQGEAQPNQVVLSEGTRSLLGRNFQVTDLGERELKGIEGQTRIFSVAGEQVVESRFEATRESLLPIIGREHELALVMDRWRLTKSGEGQGVLLVGEAGIGKSRMTRAVLDALAGEPHVQITYQCSPNHVDSALWPVVRQLTFASQITAYDDPEVRRQKLVSVIVESVDDAQDVRFLARLLGSDEDDPGVDVLDPAVQRARTLEALVRQLLALSQREPAIVVLEDAHWSDPTTLELIERTLGAIEQAQVMVLITSRPDQQPQLDAFPHMSRVALNRLGRDGVEQIVRELSPDRQLAPELIDEIIDKTDGVPLFAEELTKTVLETGATEVPATLHDSLMARLDRIGEVKEIAQVASCIGREFDYRLLASILDQSDSALQQALEKLGTAALVFSRGTPPDARYSFKHALLRDTAYESLLKSRRRDIHSRIADTLERRFVETANAEPEVVAYHLSAARQPRRAIPYWETAGRRSVENSANTEAVGHLNEALQAADHLEASEETDRIRLRIYAELAGPLISTKGYNAPESVAVFQQVQRLVNELDDDTLMFPALYQQWLAPLIAGEAEKALVVAREFDARAVRRSDDAMTLMGQRMLGLNLLEVGELAEAIAAMANAERRYRPEDHEELRYRFGQDPLAATLSFRGIAHVVTGRFDLALADVAAATRRAEEVNHANTVGYVGVFGSQTVSWALDDRSRLNQAADKTIEVSDRYGMAFWRGFSKVFRGWSAVHDGDATGGFSMIDDGFAELRESRTAVHLRLYMAMHAEALGVAGRVGEGLERIDRAFAATPEERWEEPEMHRVKGDLLITAGHVAEGMDALQSSLDIARDYGADGLALRTAVSLARAPGGKLDDLEEILERVEGGKDTPLVLRARGLLESSGRTAGPDTS